MISVGIAGASGYTGIELVNFCLSHPSITINSLFAQRNAGMIFSHLYPQFKGKVDLELATLDSSVDYEHLDCLFLALPHATSHGFMDELVAANPDLKIIDLSADFRHKDVAVFEQYYGHKHAAKNLLSSFVYGIPELNRDQLTSAQYCANPGCYAIASILGLLPLSEVLNSSQLVVIDAKSGVSGAGKVLKEGSLFCEVNEAMSAYATGSHRHVPEIQSSLGHQNLVFSPHLIPQSRGELCSIYIDNEQGLTQDALEELYKKYYETHPFVRIADAGESATTKTVVGSNCCVIKPVISEDSNTICLFSCIDNLVKGASGQAIQNMNLMFGLEESTGLNMVARYL